jgi:hypothetical protein
VGQPKTCLYLPVAGINSLQEGRGGRITLRKYRSLPRDVGGALLLLLSCPTMTMIRDMNEAAANATAGTRHILRLVFPIPATVQLPQIRKDRSF